MAKTSPAGDEVQLAAGHVGATVAQLERRIYARFGERGLTKAVRDLGRLVVLVQTEADQSRARLRRTTIAARAISITIIAATLYALLFSLRSAVTNGLEHTADWVPLVESVINDLVFAGLDADQLHHYLNYCSEMLSLTAKTAALCAANSADGVVLETISTIETLTTELSKQDMAEDLAAPPMIAFVCAMPMELRPLRRRLRLRKSGLGFAGWLGDRRVIAIVTGMGTDLARTAIVRMLDTVDVEWVIVVGITGAIDNETPIGTLVSPEVVVNSADGSQHRPTPLQLGEVTGTMWTTDELLVDPAVLADLRARGVTSLDMETAAIGAGARSAAWHGRWCGRSATEPATAASTPRFSASFTRTDRRVSRPSPATWSGVPVRCPA